MEIIKDLIELAFSAALFFNALIFVPQIIRIAREKSAKGVSLLTFTGFLLVQFTIVLHAVITHDYILLGGYVLSMLTCGSVILLILRYRKRKTSLLEDMPLEEIIAQIPGHIYWKDERCVLVGSNTSNWQDFGLTSLSEFVGKTDYDLFPKEEADLLKVTDEEVMRENKENIVEEVLTIADGTQAVFLSNKRPLKDKKGKIVGMIGCSVNVTEAKQQTLDKLSMLEDIIAVMPGNVYWMDKNGVYLGCNDNQAKVIGLESRKDIIGKRNIDLPGFLISEALDPINKEVMGKCKTIVTEEPAVLPDGTRLTVLSSKVPIRNNRNEVIGMVGISIDITDRKKAEKELMEAMQKAEAANMAKTEFLNNMRHDLRTPFSGILNITEVLEEQEDNPDKKEMLGYILQAAKQLLDHLNEIFEFTKTEEGELPILDKQFNVHQLTKEVCDMLLPSAKVKELPLYCHIDSDVPCYVIGDTIRTQRILLNLISNSIKFTSVGKVEVELSVVRRSEYRVSLQFKIIDTGMGIPEEKQEIIFERFNRLTSSYSGTYGGKGLGLRIVRRFLDEIDGEVHLQSQVGQGTTFTVIIPYKLPLIDRPEEKL